ncbi:3-phenylpropionate/cinnamic acid dioxygenase subunit beta [Paenibacillus naphthalenovorans]|uniref:3-phenylpropionate/cinnamic acid dioxygenase subunit beta n=1 Tax=Paenibacillus naphthalenovorans TaxID=162209 RepID=UPI00088E46E6|nr:3-phenylpropionate/cinnamic acid dioxygenase subunit beta [Paenibacillus naphthalenovorans]SDJ01729.1 3-phenylpropionate/cinnamic acid dioxygenase, small subunit [Paenibacillus naphthalenovorans]
MNYELHYQITNFLNTEALLLDNREFEDWLELLTDDVVYRMPVRVTKESKDGFDKNNDMAYYEETKKSLTTRVKRLRTGSAWAEDPPLRTRHFVSNIIIKEGTSSNELKVQSYFSFQRSRGVDHAVEQIFGERLDVLRNIGGDWKIASRSIYPDQTVLTIMNLSTFL